MYKHYSTFILDFAIYFKDRCDSNKKEAGDLRADISGTAALQTTSVARMKMDTSGKQCRQTNMRLTRQLQHAVKLVNDDRTRSFH